MDKRRSYQVFMPSEFLLKSVADRKTFQALFYPVSDTNFDSQSYMLYHEGYWLKRRAMRLFSNNCAHNKAIHREPAVSSFACFNRAAQGMPLALSIREA